eukprot:m.17418 g.17418  ORF g.17418 m.17418 type:complete len:99 (-) comp8281_c0_seq4:24-320(-)
MLVCLSSMNPRVGLGSQGFLSCGRWLFFFGFALLARGYVLPFGETNLQKAQVSRLVRRAFWMSDRLYELVNGDVGDLDGCCFSYRQPASKRANAGAIP